MILVNVCIVGEARDEMCSLRISCKDICSVIPSLFEMEEYKTKMEEEEEKWIG